MDNQTLRQIFDRRAEVYNEMRPSYPEGLFFTLINLTELEADANLLEIGPGTGQATKALAKKGFKITAVELGESLADVARRELASYPLVEILTGSFEETKLPENNYDLVYSATAFHWIKPEFKYVKPHHLLKNNGHLAVIHTHHVSDGDTDRYYYLTQPIYQKYFNDRPKSEKDTGTPLQTAADLKPDQLDEKLFELAHFETFEKVVSYNTADYLKLISTYSPNLAMPEGKRDAFFNDLREVVESKLSGKVERHYAMSLTIGRKIGD